MEDATKEFVFESLGEGAYVEVSQEDTLANVRELILDELDSEQLPSEQDFAFKVNGIRISTKQELKKNAFALLNKKAKVELVPKGIPRKRKISLLEESDSALPKAVSNDETTTQAGPETKRQKLSASTTVSPATETKPSEDSAAAYNFLDEITASIKNRSSPTRNDIDDDDDDESNKEDSVKATSNSETTAKAIASTNDWDSSDDEFQFSTKDAPPNNPTVDMQITNAADTNHCRASKEEDDDAFSVDFDNDDGDEEDMQVESTNPEQRKDDNDLDLDNDHNEEDDEEEELQVVNKDTNHHETSDEAKEKSGDVLSKLESILHENPLYCSGVRRKDWLQEIQELKASQAPKTVFGVLGNTGVGKSSLLNALLDEAAVLPTSGSRGCTAAVVELVYHSELAAEVEEGVPSKTVPVYQGAVEFMTLEDWKKELKILVEECSTNESKKVHLVPPDETRAPASFAAWQKIEQVYGKDSMKEFMGKSSEYAFTRLANNPRVRNYLTSTVPGQEYNVITVEVGKSTVGSAEAQDFLQSASDMSRRTRRKRNKLAQEFRKRINSYVYRKGNGSEPQTWPLIRKVQLKGPWSVLNTGAVLVDLPGVRDSNAARAKVAQSYLQNCNQIAIVAPIKRAVDDGTAKELLGEQFKRRLLMDGQYGNVFFICTQTDDLEATETMRDHADVAQRVPGRWEKMEELANSISMMENELNDLKQKEEDLAEKVNEVTEECKEAKNDLKEAKEEEVDDETIEDLRTVLRTHREALKEAKQASEDWANENEHMMDKLQDDCDKLQKKLKAMCANVRNEYSTASLQEDFRNGLKALYNNDDDNDGDGTATANSAPQNALPEDYNMDVFCISSNDYLKIMGIKSNNDGQPNTFECQRDTQIPQLRSFVHQTTARFCETHSKSFVENTNDLLDRMKLLATDASSVPTGRSAYRMKSQFEAEMKEFERKAKQVAITFKTSLDKTIRQSLMPSLQKGARSGQAVALNTVHSWGSKNRRTKHERRPDKNGLYWSTYNAVVRRNGQYTSASAGAIDFNQELCDPMEKEFSTEWQAVLDSAIKRLLRTAETSVTKICDEITQRLASGFRASGMDNSRLATLVSTAKRSSMTALRAYFQQMLSTAVESQRNLSRTLLPAVQNNMTTAYENSRSVPGGTGVFNRMKNAMTSYSQNAVDGMFFEAMKDLQNGVDKLVIDLHQWIASSGEVVQKSMANVFSICWDDQSGKTQLMDPVMMKKIRECRDALLPDFQNLCAIQLEASQLLGIEREEMELDVMGVETLDQSLERRLEEAKKNGNAFDLCDSDADVPVVPQRRIKSDPDGPPAPVAHRTSHSPRMQEIIDLCNSDEDDDWEAPPPSGLSSARNASRAVKSEML